MKKRKLFFIRIKVTPIVVTFFISWLIISWGHQNNQSKLYTFPELYNFPKMPLNNDNPVTVSGVELGRHLFYDTILSKNYTMSCATCHQQKNAFASTKRFDKGVNNKNLTRNTPPLFNLAWYKRLFWDGRSNSIENQIFEPVRSHNELGLEWKLVESRIRSSKKYRKMFKDAFGDIVIDSIYISKAIAQFERTILSYRSKYDRVLQGKDTFSYDEFQGFIIVNDQSMGNCLHCHDTDGDALGTNGEFSNNGLDPYKLVSQYIDKGRGAITKNEQDIGKFKVPTLRNVELTAPYMHDGRFESLEEVINFYSDHVNNSINVDSKLLNAHSTTNRLTKDQKKYIIAFLKTLTDYEMINDTAFALPYSINQ